MKEPLIYTFYTFGTFYIMDSYPVDPDIINNEILNPDGKIGPSYYIQYDMEHKSASMENLREYDNHWFMKEENKEVCEHLRNDLITLIKEHNMVGAYTLLGSLYYNKSKMYACFNKAAELGSKEGMVAYGLLCCAEHIPSAWKWIEKGAELGEEYGLLVVALNYHFGVFTHVDYNKAAHYYRRIIEKNYDNSYFACINLGALYVEANYFHTAMKLFKLAEERKNVALKSIKQLGFERSFENIKYCEKLLKLSVEERSNRSTVQYHSPNLMKSFFKNWVAPEPGIKFDKMQDVDSWIPDDLSEIEQADIEEHAALEKTKKQDIEPNKFYEDFVFFSTPVEIHHDRIYGNQKEFVFLEKKLHAELNKYIQRNLSYLKYMFNQCGLIFCYLPAKEYDFNEHFDSAHCYVEEDAQLVYASILNRERTESAYWNSMTSQEELPDDCAGFLHYIPQPNNVKQKKKLYDYIFFPFRPGTDWRRAFACLLDYVTRLPYINVDVDKKQTIKELHISKNYDFSLSISNYLYGFYGTGKEYYMQPTHTPELVIPIKMPVLSKTLYLLFLKHPEGIALKDLVDYKDELMELYRKLSNRKDIEKSINDLVDPTKNSANEKISRIRKAFDEALERYSDKIDMFVPTGKKGGKYKIKFDRKRVTWEL